jgi:hypothetical protein
VISMYLNCAKVWVRLIQLLSRVTGRPQVRPEAPPLTRSAR